MCTPHVEEILRVGAAVAVLTHRTAGAGLATAAERIEAAAAALRRVTGRGDIVIGRRASGRPRLEPPYPELGVSLSHRGGMLIAAFAPDGPVGVDLEVDGAGSLADPLRFARDHYAAGEAAAMRRLDRAEARDLCHRLWVAKEAALKVSGRGIYDGLAEPDFTPHLDALRQGRVVAVAACRRLPSLHVGIRLLEHPSAGRVYCALACGFAARASVLR